MREEEKETNTTPQKNQVSLSLLKSVLLWCSSFLVVALFCRGCGCGGTRVALVSLSLSRLFYCGGKKWNKKRGSRSNFSFMFRVLVKKKQTSLSRVIKVRLTFE